MTILIIVCENRAPYSQVSGEHVSFTHAVVLIRYCQSRGVIDSIKPKLLYLAVKL